MSLAQNQRVDDALQQLVSRLIPSNPDSNNADDDDDDQRWDEAINLARQLIDTAPPSTSTSDVSHAADLIRAKLVRDTGRPDKATRFSTLYSRLLTQPVLGHKWAILYFLYRLAEPDAARLRGHLELLGPDAIDSPSAAGRGAAGGEGFARRTGRRGGEAVRAAAQRERAAGQELEQGMSRQPAAPGDAALLRDLPFTLQGVGSVTLPLKGERTVALPGGLPVPLLALLNALAEPALLYRQLAAYVEPPGGGLVGQSLKSAVGEELGSYLGLVATLEGQIRKALTQVAEDQSRRSIGRAGVTLKRCVVWTRDATLGLRLMSTIVEDAEGKKGGPIITHIHRLSTSHGDPFIHTFADRLLHKVTKPFYAMLQHWIFSGVLQDPFEEFFISENAQDPNMTAISVWTDKYKTNNDLLPSVMPLELASKVFLIGKSLNFIRSSCSDSAWVEAYTASKSQELSFSDPVSLSAAISDAYKMTTARVLELMSDKFKLFDHLAALKKYLLLGQGDFIALLLESLASNLDSPANAQYRHHLTSALDHSIRNSNAQFEPLDMTRRLDARMLELSHGEIGWDVFTLEYRMDSPLDVVVDPWAQKQYLKIFNFLWRIKRVEFTLGQVWGRYMTGARGVLRFAHEAERGEKAAARGAGQQAADAELRATWKRARGGLAAMVHFVGQLQYYILFEVIESGWERLKTEMAKPSATLDTLISAHKTYLHNITRKGLLAPSTSTGAASAPATAAPAADFTSQLHELLKLMLAYKDAVEALYSHSVAEYTVRQDGRQRAAHADGEPLIRMAGEGATTGPAGLKGVQGRLEELEGGFRAGVNVLLGDLAYQQDSDMRFLGVVMNFNDVYRPARKRRGGGAAGGGRDREREGEGHAVAGSGGA